MTEHRAANPVHRGESRVRLVDVAAASGFSPSVVSRVLAGRGDVSAATRAAILQAAERLGYERSAAPSGRPRRPSRTIGLTLGWLDTAWAAEAIADVAAVAAARGFDLLLTTERDSPGDDWVERTQAGGVVGAIVGVIRPTNNQLRRLALAGIPVVLLDPCSDPLGPVAIVGTADHQGGFDAGTHLTQGGAQHFIGVVGTPQYRFGRARMEGFVEAVSDHAPLASVEVLTVDWSSRAATEALVPRLKAHRGPVGVFAVNDDLARGVYEAAAQVGIRIPQDIRVVGFDDEPRSRWMTPPLTTLQFPYREAARKAVELIADSGRAIPLPTGRIEIASQLVVRGSTVRGH
jgi:LacI family transcriptional regulator